MPYSVLTVAAPLVERGHHVTILDEYATPGFVNECLRIARDADVVGISCFTGIQIDSAVRVAQALRTQRPELLIIWGGYHPSLYPEVTARSPLVDGVITGQGEWAFLGLVEAIARGEDPLETPGLVRLREGKVVHNPHGPKFTNMEDFPAYPFDLVPLRSFLIDSLSPKSISYHSSIGCPFRCNFCTVTQIYERRWSGLSSNRVVADMKRLIQATGATSVELYDNNFFVSDERTRAIAQGLIDQRVGTIWSGEARPDKIASYDRETMQLLVRSGLRWVFIGAESGHDEVLSMMERDHTASDIVSAAEQLARHNIDVTFSFNLGYPGEPADNFEVTERLCRELIRINPRTELMVYITTAYESTPAFHRVEGEAKQSVATRTLETWIHLDQRSGDDKPWLSPDYARRLWNFQMETFFATSFLHRVRLKRRHPYNPFLRALTRAANLHFQLGYHDSILDLRALNRLFKVSSRIDPRRTIDSWTGRS